MHVLGIDAGGTRTVCFLADEREAVLATTAFFMTVWHRRSRSAESSCGIRPD